MTDSKVIETIYYLLDISILKGNLDDAKLYLELLRNEYQEDEKCFDVLKDGRLENLKKLGQIVDQKLVVKSFDFKNVENKIIEKDEDTVEKEKELYTLIYDNQQNLKNCLNITEDFSITSIYYPVTYGTIDLLGRTKETVYVIEVKKDVAKFDVIEQVHKYIFDFRMKMICKLYKKVEAVVIANSFQDYTLKELSKENIHCVKYNFKDNTLKLTKI